MSLQRFKETDEKETKIIDAVMPTLEPLGLDRDAFFDQAFLCFLLGDVLYDLERDPMSGVITRDVFRTSFFAIHELFTRPGTFDFYLQVFRAIWGDNVDVEFVVPDPGHLQINVEALDLVSFVIQGRIIEDGVYVYYDIIDHDGDVILGLSTQGIKTQNEVDALIHELAPNGIFVEAILTIA